MAGSDPGGAQALAPAGPFARTLPPGEARQRWRLVIRRARDAPPQTPGDWQAAWEQALAATELPIIWTGSRHPKPRFVSALPLPAGMAADREQADIFLAARLQRAAVREAIERVAPAGHALVNCHDVWVGAPSLPGQVVAAEYAIELTGPRLDADRAAAAVAAMLSDERLTRRRARGDRQIEYDLRPLILDLEMDADSAAPLLRMRLRHDPERGPGRPDEVLRELSDRLGEELVAGLITRTGIVLAGDPAGAGGSAGVRVAIAAEGD